MSIEELLRCDVVVPGENSNCVKQIKHFFNQNGYEFSPKYYFTTTDLIEKFVTMSNCVGIVLEKEISRADVKLVATDLELPSYTVYKIWKDNAGDMVKAFLSLL